MPSRSASSTCSRASLRSRATASSALGDSVTTALKRPGGAKNLLLRLGPA